MKLDLVDPKLHKTANVMELFLTKLIGSIGPSVFIIKVSEALMKIIPNGTKLTSMQFAMTIIPVMALIGAVFFFITVYRLKKKKKKAEMLSAIIIQK
ncbi:protein spinster homolog 1-like [Xenopus laevis]|nr:protein spinster homolog 1-like [Xenopus laevis]